MPETTLQAAVPAPSDHPHRRRNSFPRQHPPVCRREDPPSGERDGREGGLRQRPHPRFLPARPDGHRDSRAVRRRRRQVLRSDPGRRGTVARGCILRRHRRRAEHAGQQRPAALGQRRAEEALPAEDGHRDRGRLRPQRSRFRLGRFRAANPRRAQRQRVRSQRPQALDHQRQRSGTVRALRHARSQRRIQRHHCIPGRERISPDSPSARRKTSSASARRPPAS